MKLYVIKIGGSVCTEKQKGIAKVRKLKVKEIGKEIKRAGLNKKFKLIIVHGAGPFGHVPVKKYKINNGVKTEHQWEGVQKTQESVARENKEIVKTLEQEGIPTVGITTHYVCKQNQKKIIQFNTELFKEIVEGEMVPVVYGDMVLDTTLGASVVSGDALVPYLAKKLNATKVFYGADVNGIYEGDPKENKGAKLIPKITNTNYRTVLEKVSGSKGVDVTGGMRGKIEKLRTELKGKEIVIFNMNEKGNTYRALMGKLKECTGMKFT